MTIPTSGALIGSRFRIETELGRGNYGVTFAAIDEQKKPGDPDYRCAVKVIFRQDPSILERFQMEAQVLQRVDSARLPKLIEWGADSDTGSLFLVQQFISGISLERMMGVPHSEGQARRWLDELLEALDALSVQSIIHRDIKPANIIISDRGLVLVDCGASIIQRLDAERTGTFTGTLNFACVDQIYGSADRSTDLYSVGRVILTMLLGYIPECSPLDIHAWEIDLTEAHTSRNFIEVLKRLTSQDKTRRFYSVRDVRVALESPERASQSALVVAQRAPGIFPAMISRKDSTMMALSSGHALEVNQTMDLGGTVSEIQTYWSSYEGVFVRVLKNDLDSPKEHLAFLQLQPDGRHHIKWVRSFFATMESRF